ncbi:MAG: tRNA (5-methylaminomethyl-2-thiouridine)(34)-methyltransferase MnmD [Bacteroidetes bacterium]|nr:tRNA (5-methylaminomethyl-2-thiouridine)(34)-methyltransferase MnmD [Bacteroidota bacterium]
MDFSNRKIVKTADGSNTLKLNDVDENFHSCNGAITESMHIFINNGLLHIANLKNDIRILEVGFGTGLNALLTIIKAKELNLKVYYLGYEAFPLNEHEYKSLNYYDIIGNNSSQYFYTMHECEFDKDFMIADNFSFCKKKEKIEEAHLPKDYFDIIYFDAFAPDIQPELWSIEIFQKISNSLKSNGMLITYSAKGEVRRNLKNADFIIEKLPGPPGKREITRAVKR